ncbi:MAG: hypothetical protein ACK56I_30915, partial [bacterium]
MGRYQGMARERGAVPGCEGSDAGRRRSWLGRAPVRKAAIVSSTKASRQYQLDGLFLPPPEQPDLPALIL